MSRKNTSDSGNAAENLFQEALALHRQDKRGEAVTAYRATLRHNPHHAAAWTNLGSALRQAGHLEAAAACSKRALELSPGNSSYLSNYGNTLTDLNRMREALQAHEEAVRHAPGEFLTRRNYAISLREFARYEEALIQFNAACALQPDDPHIQWDRAITYLHLGRFQEGWEAFEVRWKLGQMTEASADIPRWRGENLTGKTILIYAEQGFGDTILCSRYIPMVKMRGGRVILACKPALHRLFGSVYGIDQMVAPDGKVPKFDYHVPMMSLPGIFGTDLQSIPPIPTLSVPDTAPAEAQRLLDLAEGKFKVGIVWSGSVTFKSNHRRAVAASRFLPFAEIPGVQLFSLQKGPCEGELAECGGQGLVHELGPHLNDFAETAAVLRQLDLVIMTDSSVAHLAGSVDCPVWNLLHYNPYWLYFSERQDSPWYPPMRLIRQQRPGDWDAVFARAAADLEKYPSGEGRLARGGLERR